MTRDDDHWEKFRRVLRLDRYPQRTLVDDYPLRVSHEARAALVEQCQRAKHIERTEKAPSWPFFALLVGVSFLIGAVAVWALTSGRSAG